jgi:23S rRNA (uracil1939-C5)-methyltransferase
MANHLEITIESLSHEGRGIAHHDGKIIFVDGALPQEIVIAELSKRHPRYDEARVVEIKQASPYRVEPRCQHFAICGGCDLQHLHPEQQIILKQQTLLEQFKHFGNLQPEIILPPLRGPAWEYRHKARLAVKYVTKKQKLLIGFHEKNGRFIADLSRCEVLHPKAGLLIEPLRELIAGLKIYNQLAQIEVAIDDHNIALILRHLVDLPESDKENILSFAQLHNIHLYLQPNKPQLIQRIWPITGEESLSYHNDGIDFKFHPTDFTQINPSINRQMIELTLTLLELNDKDNVLDLFCGLGNFTLPIAKRCNKVTGIEGDKNMVERAKQNAIENAIINAEFYVSNLFEPTPDVKWMQQSYNKVVLDPPRTGAFEIIQQISQWRPSTIVYVSCNPSTLARDAGELVHGQGYRLVKTGVMDMFPHTKHVESIALFIRNEDKHGN